MHRCINWLATILPFQSLSPANRTFVLLTSLLALSACKPSAEISSTHLAIGSGNSTELHWEAKPQGGGTTLTTVSISPDVGEVEATGSIEVFPSTTTVYTITVTAHDNNGKEFVATADTTVHVDLPVTEVPFADDIFRACVERYNLSYAHEVINIACGDLLGITPYNNITDLEGVQYFSQLESLLFYRTTFTETEILTQLPTLSNIRLYGSEVDTLKYIAQVPQLSSLLLADTKVSSLFPLFDIASQLEDVELINNLVACVQMISLGAKLPEDANYSYVQIGAPLNTCTGP